MSIRKTDLTYGVSSADLVTFTTASITPSPNKLILLSFVASSTLDTNPTVAGCGLTWEKVAGQAYDYMSGFPPTDSIVMYRAMGSNPSAGTVTVTFGDIAQSAFWSISEFDGVPLDGENGSGAIVQSVVGGGDAEEYFDLTLDEFESPYNVVYGVIGMNTNVAVASPGAGYTEIHQDGSTTPFVRGITQWRNAPATLFDASIAGALNWAGIAVEIKGLIPPPQTGKLNPDLKTSIAQGRAFSVFEFDDPSNTTHLYCGSWQGSETYGEYKGYIEPGGFGISPSLIPLRGDSIESISTSVTVVDKDGVIKDLVTGEYARQTRGMDARIRLVAPNISADAYHLRFNGQVLRIKKAGQNKYTFDLGAKLSELEGFLHVPIVTEALWPNAHPRALGKRTPLVYGIHSSASLGSRGMLPTLYVDTTGYRYLAAHQYIEEITNVYVDYVVQGSGWAEVNEELEGHRYTLIDFDLDQGDSVITFDAKGAVFEGDISGSNTVMLNPATQIKFILANYAFNSWNGKPADWHDETDSPIDQDLFYVVEQFFNSRGVSGSISIPDETTGLKLINLWSREYCPIFWTSDAKLGVRTDDWYSTRADWTTKLPRITEHDHFVGELVYDRSDDIIYDEWDIGFLYSQSDKEALQRIRVKDTLRGWNIAEKLDLLWSESTV